MVAFRSVKLHETATTPPNNIQQPNFSPASESAGVTLATLKSFSSVQVGQRELLVVQGPNGIVLLIHARKRRLDPSIEQVKQLTTLDI